MLEISNKLNKLAQKSDYRVMIIGLGSVGLYLLEYLLEMQDERLTVIVAGRNNEKMTSDVNIVRIGAMIRGHLKSKIIIDSSCELNDESSVERSIAAAQPDIIVNSSRAYPGLKYGSISWNNFRAYGIWSPLSIRYIRGIMTAAEKAAPNAIVINTSYSDAIIPWMKSAGKPYPDFGSGNLNHLVPRIKLAAARACGISDEWNIEVTMATGHFHDVVISKEGQNEGIEQLISVKYNGSEIKINQAEILRECSIPMPVDAKRNIMNASSNFEIIDKLLSAVSEKKSVKFHSPGVFGNIGGYPVAVNYSVNGFEVKIDESCFAMSEMLLKNKQSLYLDGIEKVENGTLYYTDELIAKVKNAFGTVIPKAVHYDDIDNTADLIIKNIIEKKV